MKEYQSVTKTMADVDEKRPLTKLIYLYSNLTGMVGYGYNAKSPSHSWRIFDFDAYIRFCGEK